MLLPFEFSYTREIWVEDVLSPFRDVLRFCVFNNPIKIRIWHILAILWGFGIIVSLGYKLKTYKSILRLVSFLPEISKVDLFERYHLDKKLLEGLEGVTVVVREGAFSPFVIGLRKPYIILQDAGYSDEQICYILLHEWMHITNKDIFLKFILDLFCTVFWWNPIITYFEKELFRLIEIQNDQRLTMGFSEETVVRYMQCLKDVALQLSGKETPFALSFNKSNGRELERRLEFLANKGKICYWHQILLSVVFGVLMVASFFVIIEPYSYKEVEEEGVCITEENAFIVENGECYDVYIEGKYGFTVNDLIGLDNIVIYESIEEANENETE